MANAQLGIVARDLNTLFGVGIAGSLTDAELLERFITRRDEDAFAALVARHGPMVLAVCRGVLRPHEAEDAFQATFVILAIKAKTLRHGQVLGVWLHQVARRVACQVNIGSMRRAARERRAALPEAQWPKDGRICDEVLAALHEEIDRLPEKYRVPVVLCELGDATREQAAHQLPVMALLQRLGSATGRMLDGAGKPAAGVMLHFRRAKSGHVVATTDHEGRFRAEGLIPGLEYTGEIVDGKLAPPTFSTFSVSPGESKKLGDAHTELPPLSASGIFK